MNKDMQPRCNTLHAPIEPKPLRYRLLWGPHLASRERMLSALSACGEQVLSLGLAPDGATTSGSLREKIAAFDAQRPVWLDAEILKTCSSDNFASGSQAILVQVIDKKLDEKKSALTLQVSEPSVKAIGHRMMTIELQGNEQRELVSLVQRVVRTAEVYWFDC